MEKHYDRLDEGKIILVKNFKFPDGTLDHAWNKGRLCLILFTDDKYEYVLTIKSNLKDKAHLFDNYYINKDSMLYFYDNVYTESTLKTFRNGKYVNKLTKNSKGKKNIEGYVNLNRVYKIPIVYRSEISKVDYTIYKDILERLFSFYKVEDKEDIKKLTLQIN